MKTTDHGNFIVIRDTQGKAMERLYKDPSPRETARTAVRKMTNNLLDMYAVLINIANGVPVKYQLEDGQESEPIYPSFETRRAAAKDVIDFTGGKAVAQTEVAKAEVAAIQSEQLAAMTDAQLFEIVNASDIRVLDEPKQLESAAGESAVDDER
jgi:hypothetical protein